MILILESCICAEVVAAVDVNTLANEVYKHNFPSTPLWAKTIEVSNDFFHSSQAFLEVDCLPIHISTKEKQTDLTNDVRGTAVLQ